MTAIDVVSRAWRRVRSRWLESLLIVLAIALGVAVITAIAAVLGVNARNRASFEESLAARQIVIRPLERDYLAFRAASVEPVDARPVGSIYSGTVRFTLADIEAAKAAAPSADYGYAWDFMTFYSPVWGSEIAAVGITGDYFPAARIEVASGSAPSPVDFETASNVIVLTPRFATMFGLEGDPLGQQVEFTGQDAPYTVIGVLKGDTSTNLNIREGLVPMRPGSQVSELWFAVENSTDLEAAVRELEVFAEARWFGDASVQSLRDGTLDGMRLQSSRDLVVALFAAIALAVAAFNVVAMMLARVSRRDNEIGVDRSLGASRASVATTVVTEAALLGAAGALLGVPVGYWLMKAYNGVIANTPGMALMEVPFTLTTAVIGILAAIGWSALAGLYPAVVASRVRVVDALRGTG